MDDAWSNLVPAKFGGHALMGRLCVEGVAEDGDFWARQVDGIYLSQFSANRSFWFEVLRKGPRVGKVRVSPRAPHNGMIAGYCDIVEPGALLLCPNMHIGVFNWAAAPGIVYVDECVPYGMSAPEEDGMIRPLGNRVLIEVVDRGNRDEAGGIALPDQADHGVVEGKVLAVGPGVLARGGEVVPCNADVGDTVHVQSKYLIEVVGRKRNLALVRDDDILNLIPVESQG